MAVLFKSQMGSQNMILSTQRKHLLLSVCLATLLAGCGGSDRPALATASGIVTLDGEPVEGAAVSFIPAEGGRPGSGMTDSEGRYTIKTFEDAPGAIVGEHKVSVMKISGPGASALQGAGAPPSEASGEDDGSDMLSQIPGGDHERVLKTIYDVPQNYMNPDESGLRLTVPDDGSETLDLKLSS